MDILKKILGVAANKIKTSLYLDFGGIPRTVLLAGSGRSGTTWVQEVLNTGNDFRLMFEPFHSRYVPLVQSWEYRQYIPEDNDEPRFLLPAEKILSGRIRNNWVDNPNRKLIAGRRLIKDVCASLFLKWINENFPEIPIIFFTKASVRSG